MSHSLFASLDRLLLEFVFQYEQDIRAKEDIIQRANKCFEDIKETKVTICKIHETINKTDEEIDHYYKHSNEIKDNCSNWKPTCDVFRKHEDYMQDQFTLYQETIEKDKKRYHDYVCQYKDVLKQYQLKYLETPFSHEYYEKKKEHEEIQKRVLACTEQLKMNETIFMKFLVPAPFPSVTKWTLHMVNLRCKTQDVLKHANNFTKSSSELKKEVDEKEIEINYLNQQLARLYENKNLSETLEEKNKNIEKRKELKERIFDTDEHLLALNKTSQSSQLFLPYESQKLVRSLKIHSSESRVTDKKEESSAKQLKLDNIDFRQKDDTQIFNDSSVNSHSKCSQVTAKKGSQNFMQFRLLTSQKQLNCNQWFEKGDTDAEYGEKGTVRQLRESKCTSQAGYTEHIGKPTENNSDEIEERTDNFPPTPEIPLFLTTPEPVKTPESLKKLQLPKTPLFESNRNRNAVPEVQTQKESPGFSFLMSYTSRSPGLNLFDSSIFETEVSSDQFSEHSAENLNPLSSQEIGNLFEKPEGEDTFTFSFPSVTSTHTFGAGKDDFSFPFSFEQDENSIPSSLKGFSSSSQNTTQFTFF
ncbi:protein SIX6OS1 [Otolemur garnettii]|uniref:protein SIX6OS1 n=1 Tax=Otolemur garnettii TaxID=30611 RepID=UPI00027415F3|nr:protein SIX6OS1 [Otolemur garnettii]